MVQDVRILAFFGGVARLGSERANLEALSALVQAGCVVRLIVSDAPGAKSIRDDVVTRGFEVVPCPYLLVPRSDRRLQLLAAYPAIIARASWILFQQMRRFRPTYIYASSQMFILNFLPVLLLTNTPLIYRCGDKPIMHNALFRMIWRFIVRRARRVVAVSHYIANVLRETGILAGRITVIYSRPASRSVETPMLARSSGEFTFVFVGQINESKGCHFLIEAFRGVLESHPEARLLVAGRISDWEGDNWARALRDGARADPTLAATVNFCGFVEDIQGLLAAGEVVVIPTITEEPLANVVMEAKLAQRPSIIFPSGGLPEVIEHGVDGFLCTDKSVASLRDAMVWYLERRGEARSQGQAARRSLDRLGTNAFVDRWAEVIGQNDRDAA
jgi:glycosyltransferase involved in cell wall biosynthesis